MIIRSKRTQNFTVIPNAIMDDKSLDWKDLGLLVFLLSKPDEWDVSVSHLAKQRKAGRDSIMGALKSLRDAGYVLMKRKHDGGVDYVVYDTPQKREIPLGENPEVEAENPKPEKPLTENPTMGKATNGKSGCIVKTETTTKTEKELVKTDLEKKTRAKKFTPPTADEVRQFATEQNLNLDGFFEYYGSNGWKVGGKAPMVDWHLAAHGWHKRSKQFANNSQRSTKDFNQTDYRAGTEGFETNA